MDCLIEEPLSQIKKVTHKNAEFIIHSGFDSGDYYIKFGRRTLVLVNDDTKKPNETIFKFYFDNEFIFKEIFDTDHPFHVENHFKTHFSLHMTDKEIESLIKYDGFKASKIRVHSDSRSRTYIKNICNSSEMTLTLINKHIDLHDFFGYYFSNDERMYIDNNFIENESKALKSILSYSSFLSVNLFKSLVNKNFFIQIAYKNGIFKYFCFNDKNNRLSVFDIDNNSDLINSFEIKKNFEDSLKFSLEMILKISLMNMNDQLKDVDVNGVTFENIDAFSSVLDMISC
jgi:hypothetical protein